MSPHMALGDWFRPPRSLLTLYLAGAALGLVCLGWLAARQLRHEEVLELQQTQQRLNAAASRVAALMQQEIAALGRLSSAESGALPPGTAIVSAGRMSARVEQGTVPYLPVVPASAEISPPDL